MVFPLPHTSSLNRFYSIKKPLFFCMSVIRAKHYTIFFAEKKMTPLKDLFPLLAHGRPDFTACGQKTSFLGSMIPTTNFSIKEIARHSAETVFRFFKKKYLLNR